MKAWMKSAAFELLSIIGHNDDGKIVFYHDLHMGAPKTAMSTTWPTFVEHCAAARRAGWRFVNQVPCEKKTVQVCLDDGFAGVWDVRNELVELGILPTIYIAVDLIGREGYLTREQIRALQSLGFAFECHTWTHRGLTEIDECEWGHEIVDSKKWLSDFLQQDVHQLCFPKGLFSRGIYDLAMEAGYDRLVSSIPGSVKQGCLPQVLPRNLVQFYTPREYMCVLEGALGVLSGRYRRMHVAGEL